MEPAQGFNHRLLTPPVPAAVASAQYSRVRDNLKISSSPTVPNSHRTTARARSNNMYQVSAFWNDDAYCISPHVVVGDMGEFMRRDRQQLSWGTPINQPLAETDDSFLGSRSRREGVDVVVRVNANMRCRQPKLGGHTMHRSCQRMVCGQYLG